MAERKSVEDTIEIISKMKIRIGKRIEDKIRKIISLCYDYPIHDKTFTFDKDADLDAQVNRLLIELSDEIYNDFQYYATQSIILAEDEEDKDKIFALIFGEIDGKDALYRIDQHSSDLKSILESAIAIGFANSMTKEALAIEILRNINNFYQWDKMLDAYKDNAYEAEIIKAKGYSFGKGNNRNIQKAMELIGLYSIIGSFNYASQLIFEKEGAIGWTTQRGSSYDCPYCDSMVGIVHPITEPFVGFHPRCMCVIVPIFA